tara:strand:+ start:3599 stop:3922 length:324 start_codon:yes stop_codon:yes gene_type:complete
MNENLDEKKSILKEKILELNNLIKERLSKDVNDEKINDSLKKSSDNLLTSIDSFIFNFNEIMLKINEKKQSNSDIINSLKLYLNGLEEVIDLLQNSVTDIKNNYNIK